MKLTILNLLKVRRLETSLNSLSQSHIYKKQDAGYECVSYTDSVKALQEFRPNYYNFVILDIKMPVLDGFELCKKIIELDKTVHIIFITASEEYYEQFRGQHFPELGKINYIQKPIGNEELVRLVNMIVANSITMD